MRGDFFSRAMLCATGGGFIGLFLNFIPVSFYSLLELIFARGIILLILQNIRHILLADPVIFIIVRIFIELPFDLSVLTVKMLIL